MPLVNVRNLIDLLREGGFLVATDGEPPRLVPAQAPERVRVRDLLRHVRRYGEDPATVTSLPQDAPVGALEETIQEALDQALGDLSLKELARNGGSTAATPG
jgi:hypothetical protein